MFILYCEDDGYWIKLDTGRQAGPFESQEAACAWVALFLDDQLLRPTELA